MEKHSYTLPRVGQFIREHRKATKLSQAEMARVAGCSTALIQQYETGVVQDPQSRILYAIAEQCGINHGTLFDMLIEEKYGIEIATIPRKTERGMFYAKTPILLEQIRANMRDGFEAWFIMHNIGTHTSECREQYLTLFNELFDQEVRLQFILPDSHQTHQLKEQFFTLLRGKYNESWIDSRAHFPLQAGLEQVAENSATEDPMALYMDEFYFVYQKPLIADEGDVKGYEALPFGGLIEGSVFEMNPDVALRKFKTKRADFYQG